MSLRCRKPLVFVILLVSLPVLMLIAADFGAVRLDSWGILIDSLFGSPSAELPAWQKTVFWQVRLPRVVLAALVGGALALAGAVMQGVFRNPMADPGVIGISGGASLGAVLSISTGLALQFPPALPFSAFIFACGAAFLVYIVSTMRGKTSVATLLLAGVAVGGIASSLTSFVLSMSLESWDTGRQIVFWLMGGLHGKGWNDIALSAPLIIGGSLLLLIYSRDLNVMASGEEVAQSLGVDVPRARREMLVLATAVTASAVAVSGTLVFVGLMVPHILRMLIGPEHRSLMLASFLGGASLLIAADLLARTVIAPEEIRLGIITSLMGGPFFLYLLVAHKLRVESI